MTDPAHYIKSSNYHGPDRRSASPAVRPAGAVERRGIPAPAAAPVIPAGRAPVSTVKPHRILFKVTEITKTSLGVSRITLAAQQDALNTSDSANPKGSISFEVDPNFADGIQLGAAFILTSQ